MLKYDIRKYVIVPALKECDLWSPSAEILVYGTGLVESNYDYLVQIGNPPNGGKGFFEQQDDDYHDQIKGLLASHILHKVLSSCGYSELPENPFAVVYNIKFAALMCRLHYARYEEPLPKPDDALGMAQYHKKYYNGGSLGKANVDINTKIFEGAINEK